MLIIPVLWYASYVLFTLCSSFFYYYVRHNLLAANSFEIWIESRFQSVAIFEERERKNSWFFVNCVSSVIGWNVWRCYVMTFGWNFSIDFIAFHIQPNDWLLKILFIIFQALFSPIFRCKTLVKTKKNDFPL